jgi:hypothetical protein
MRTKVFDNIELAKAIGFNAVNLTPSRPMYEQHWVLVGFNGKSCIYGKLIADEKAKSVTGWSHNQTESLLWKNHVPDFFTDGTAAMYLFERALTYNQRMDYVRDTDTWTPRAITEYVIDCLEKEGKYDY